MGSIDNIKMDMPFMPMEFPMDNHVCTIYVFIYTRLWKTIKVEDVKNLKHLTWRAYNQ